MVRPLDVRDEIRDLWNVLLENSVTSEDRDRTEEREAVEKILYRYAEPHRHYHNIRHIVNMCEELADIDEVLQLTPAFFFGVVGHDVIYDTHRSDNEIESAAFMEYALDHLHVPRPIRSETTTVILVTDHKREPTSNEQRLIVDLDLAILGKPPAIFNVYDGGIRAEYAWVPDAEYRAGRAAILQTFLERAKNGTLYRTPHFQERYTAQAVENLSRAIERLRADQ